MKNVIVAIVVALVTTVAQARDYKLTDTYAVVNANEEVTVVWDQETVVGTKAQCEAELYSVVAGEEGSETASTSSVVVTVNTSAVTGFQFMTVHANNSVTTRGWGCVPTDVTEAETLEATQSAVAQVVKMQAEENYTSL